MSSIKELDVVETLVDIPAQGGDEAIAKGSLGTVLEMATVPYPACMVEFSDDEGCALAMPWVAVQHLKLHWQFPGNKK